MWIAARQLCGGLARGGPDSRNNANRRISEGFVPERSLATVVFRCQRTSAPEL